jgi:hypothetical protein
MKMAGIAAGHFFDLASSVGETTMFLAPAG